LNDFWYTDYSGYGGGVEDVDLGVGKFALAYIGSANPTMLTVQGVVPKSTVDARLYDMKMAGGDVAVWYDYSYSKAGTATLPSAGGHAIGVSHRRGELLGGYNQASFQYGNGVASNLVATLQTPTVYWKDAQTMLLTDHMLFEKAGKISFMPVFVMGMHKTGAPGVDWQKWVSLGARPVYYFNRHVISSDSDTPSLTASLRSAPWRLLATTTVSRPDNDSTFLVNACASWRRRRAACCWSHW
jgi:maltoporin